MKKVKLSAFLLLSLILFTACAEKFSFKKEFSDIKGDVGVEIAKDDSYIELDTNPGDMKGGDYASEHITDDIIKVNKKLGFSEVINKKIGNTTGADGILTQTNKNFKASWSYSPDKGLEIIYEKLNK